MTQYNLASNYIDVLVADASLYQLWRQQTFFDNIITDRKSRSQFLGNLFFSIKSKLFYCLAMSCRNYFFILHCLVFVNLAPYGIREPTEKIGANKTETELFLGP